MSIWIHCSSSLIRSQRKNATSLNHVLNLLNNRNGIEKKIAPFLGGVDTSWWLKARFLVQAPHRAGQGPAGTSSWLGWAPARQVCVAPNLPAVQRDGRKGEAQALGQAACSPSWKATSLQTGSASGWTGAPRLPNVASGKAPSLSRSVSSPALKNTSVKCALLCTHWCRKLRLGWQKQSPDVSHVLQEGHSQLPRTIIKRIGTEKCTH